MPTPDITGRIFNIMRFSTHDGPGIRTTVFLKGCPLACWWCHNPENWGHVPGVVYIKDRCIGCGACIAACPNAALSLTPEGVLTDPERCRGCGACVAACPAEARESTGRAI
ncbi:MAG TPA: 4Fe-4S binding protein, partial [Desulfobacterales bacterium]|nr:4Fe-4S binding protein [Desulfobacterales bacterium]